MAANAFHHLYDDATALQLDLFAFIKLLFSLPMEVPHKVAAFIVNHYAFVEGVVFEAAIFPSFLLPPEVVGEQADKIEDKRGARAAARVR